MQRQILVGGRFVLRALYRKPSGTWAARIRDLTTGRVRERSSREATEQKARQEIVSWLEGFLRAEPGNLDPQPLEEAFERFLELRDVRPPTLALYRTTARTLVEAFGDLYTDELTYAHVEDWVAERRRRGNAPRTIGIHLGLLRRFYRWARLRGYAQHDPTEGFRIAQARHVGQALTLEQVARLLGRVATPLRLPVDGRRRRPYRQRFGRPRHLYLAVAIAVYTGLRARNTFGLRWRQVDLERRRIDIRAEEMKGNRPHAVPLHPALARLLREEASAREPLELDGPVVGARLLGMRTSFQRALEDEGLPRLRWHDLRHTFASLMASRSSFAALQSLLGHAPQSVTVGYCHATWEELEEAIGRLPDIIRQNPEQTVDPGAGAG